MNFFENESESVQLGDLTVENRLDRINFYGRLDVTRDLEGLSKIVKLRKMLDRIEKLLVRENAQGELPEHITITDAVEIDNPFETQ